MIVEGRAVLVRGDNIDTDVLYPGAQLNIDEVEEMKPYLFEGLDPSLRDELGGDTVLVVDENFGAGSSREHVPLAMRAWGIRCLVGKSFARIFYRNCINLGLLVVTCPEVVDAATSGAMLSIDTETREIEVDGRRFQAHPIAPFVLEMISAGGLVAWGERRLANS